VANSILYPDLLMIDKFPGAVNRNLRTPTAEELRTAYLTEAAAGYKLGDKVEIIDPDTGAPVRFMFAKFMKGATDKDVAVGDFAGLWTTTPVPFELINDAATALLYGPLAICCFTLDYGAIFTTGGASYVYGWFCVGGMAPIGICKTAAGVKSFSALESSTSTVAAGSFAVGNAISTNTIGLIVVGEAVVQGAGSVFGLVAAH
jgi:hypothetical protein